MERQIITFWENEVKPRFRKETLEFNVETPYFRGRYVNLDNAATTSPFSDVENRVMNSLVEYGSVHRGSGQKSKLSTDKYESARDKIREFVGASIDNYVVFTKNTTEAINQAASLYASIPGKVLVSDIEHSSNLLPWLKNGEVIQYRTNKDGTINEEEIERVFQENSDIKLLTITGSSNVTGYKPPVYNLAKIAHKYGAKILVDVCQLIPHKKVDIKPDDDTEHLDFIAFSGHKMYAPFGAGVLVGAKSFFDEALPYQIGGGNLPYITRDLQVKRFKNVRAHDPGTPNAMGAIAIERAIKVLEEIGYENVERYENELTHDAFKKLRSLEDVVLHVSENELGTVLPFEIKGYDSYLVSEILAQEYGIGVRAGSFCTYELLRKLKGIDDEVDKRIADEVEEGITRNIPNLIRASFSLINNSEDVDRLVNAIKDISQRKPEDYKEGYEQDEKTGRYSLK